MGLQDVLITLASTESALRRVTLSRDELVRQYGYLLTRPAWERVLFRSDGRPVKAIRRLLFRVGGRPRSIFHSLVLDARGQPRGPFRQWMSSPEYSALSEADTVLRGNKHNGQQTPIWNVQVAATGQCDADIDQLMEQIRTELEAAERS